MRGSQIHSAADYLAPHVDAIDPRVTAMCTMPIDKYRLADPKVLDAIARVAGSPQHDAVRTYDNKGKVGRELSNVQTLSELFQRSKAHNVTFNVENLERYIPEVNAFAIDLSALYGATVAVHAFVSASDVPSTPLHYDYTDAYTFQLYGKKWWRCYEYNERPRFGPEGHQVNPAAVGGLSLDRVLVEGDCLFVPMGGLHLVKSLPDSDSVHLAVSVKPLGYYRFMAETFGPNLDQPQWVGLDFEGHAHRLARLVRETAASAAEGDVVARARNAVWHHIYESYLRAPYPSTLDGGARATGVPLRRRLGRPVGVTYGDNCIALEFIDPDLTGSVGRFEFKPSRVELPPEARPFVEMLQRGDLDRSQLLDYFDADTAHQLFDLLIQIGLFE
jgi:hypothetical protein